MSKKHNKHQKRLDEIQEMKEQIRQRSNYDANGKATPDNNPFFEVYSNPLSSKGN